MKKILLAIVLTITLIGCEKVKTQDVNGNIIITKDEYESLKNVGQPEYPKYLGHFSTFTDASRDRYTDSSFDSEISVIVIDSCEYVGSIWANNADLLAHKGNCKFCEQRQNLRSEKLLGELAFIKNYRDTLK